MKYLKMITRVSLQKSILLFLCIILGGCTNAAKQRIWYGEGPEVPGLSVLDATMKDFMVSREVSAGSLAVTRQGRLVFARGYTWSKGDFEITEPVSLFRIASLSKPLTAAAVLRLVEDNQLRLDEKVADVLALEPPEGRTADPNLGEVTIRHLLQHLGGWDRGKSFDPMFEDERISEALSVPLPITQADIIRFMNGQPLQCKPGTKYAYSNYGYCLLGRVIEQRSGESYGDYIRSVILSPLGIKRMCLGRSEREGRVDGEVTYESEGGSPYGSFNLENMDSHGGWLASAVDLVRFAAAFDDPCNCPILSYKSIETMFSLPEHIAVDEYKPGERYYACGWAVRDYGNGRRNTWHSGSLPGSFTFMARWADGIDCVALFNKRGPDFGEIDKMLREAVKSVSNWPEHDLFLEMLKAKTVTKTGGGGFEF